jgi:type IV secretory pathway TraG/TraD family ATPase VirD4
MYDLDDGLSEEERRLYRRRKVRVFWLFAVGLMTLIAWATGSWSGFWLLMVIIGFCGLFGLVVRSGVGQVDRVIRPVAQPPTRLLTSDEPPPKPADPRYWQPDHSKEKPHGDARLGTGDVGGSLGPASPAAALGIAIGRSLHSRHLRYYTSDRHLLTIAPNRSGKGRGSIIPALLTVPASCVCIDPKGENCAVTMRRRKELGQTVRVLNPFKVLGLPTDTLNPLDAIEPDSEDLPELADELADMLVLVQQGDKDGHWSDEAKALIAGLILHVATSEPPERRHLPRVRDLLTSSPETWDATIADMALSDAAGGLVRRAANRLRQKSPEEASGVISMLFGVQH